MGESPLSGLEHELINWLKHFKLDPLNALCIMNVLDEREERQMALLEYLEAIQDNPPEMDDMLEEIADIVDQGLPEDEDLEDWEDEDLEYPDLEDWENEDLEDWENKDLENLEE